MKKHLLKIFLVSVIAIIIGCLIININNPTEKAGKRFINEYYSQYEKGEELNEIIESLPFNKKPFDEFIEKHFAPLVTEDCLDILIANRYIPKINILQTNIKKVDIDKYLFNNKTNFENKVHYSFKLDISIADYDDSITKKQVEGVIIMEKVDKKWLVSYFKVAPLT